jgi:hypothetical protein
MANIGHRTVTALLLGLCAFAAHGAEAVRADPWELHSSFWMSLHQTLMDDVTRSGARDLTALTEQERAAWNAAVAAYRTAAGHGDITTANAMTITNDAISQTSDDGLQPPANAPLTEAPLAEALQRAAPVYRAHWWAADDRANRFFIGYAAAMARDAGPGLIREHERVYGAAWPKRVLVYVSPYGGPFGAYTMWTRSGTVITTMTSRESGYQGLRALEMLLHESSHFVVSPNHGAVADALKASAKKRGVEVPHQLWHAILFATSGELTRRALEQRGVSDFVPSSDDMLTRVWAKYREPIRKFWIPYVHGQGTLAGAIDEVLGALTPAKQ